MQISHDIALENIQTNKEKSKTYYDRSINPKTYKKGDKILLTSFQRQKLDSLRDPIPYTVIDSNKTHVTIKKGGKIIKVNINNTKPYFSDRS